MTEDTLRERQEGRELTQHLEGITRYRKEAAAMPVGEQRAGRGLVNVAAMAMIPILKAEVAKLESGESHPSQVPLPYHYLSSLDAEATACIAARVCVSAAYERGKLTRTAMRIANLIEEDYRFDETMQAEPALAKSMERAAKRWSSSGARRRIMRKAADVAKIKRLDWTEEQKVKLGGKLIEVFIETTGFAELTTTFEGSKTSKLLVMTPEVEQRINDNHDRIEADRPINSPMIYPPVPWTSPLQGGYLTERLRAPMVRTRSQETRDDLFSSDMTGVYDALNHIQATRWRINSRVLEVLQQAHAGNGQLAGLPQMDPMPLPDKPVYIVKGWTAEHAPEAEKNGFTEWKMKTREAHEFNAKLRSKRLALLTKLRMAEELEAEEAIYFPHSLDFRGRVYSMTAELSPQSDDVAKSLLEFADGKPLGKSGGFWLGVHIANLFGVDKISFEDRVLWVMTHKAELIDSGTDPLDGQRFWTEADDPWCALAACIEFAGFMEQGDDFVSHLPIAMDGSCSGIQHFSAMLKDAEGGRAVNLLPSDTPCDIYTEVLDVTRDLLKASPDPIAKVWLDKVDRKIVKRPCMTFAYSVTSIGIREQIASEMRKKTDGQYLPGHENWESAAYLAPLVEQAIRQVVDRAAEAMDWLKKISGEFAVEEIPAMWVTPLGFPVVQPYRKQKGKRVMIWFGGERIRLNLTVEMTDVDKRKHASSIAPNYVHSMDATHLMMVVNRLAFLGITDSFAMIHDSFGVHACDVDEMQYVIRDEFIKLYSEDQLAKVYQSTLLALPGERWPDVATPPEAGTLDLEEVRDADFFFA